VILASLVLPLEGPLKPQPIHARGLLYGLLREHAPELHERQGLKPFTVAVGGREAPWLRFTFLDEGLYAALSPALYGLAGQDLHLGDTIYKVKTVLQENHPWAGMTTWPRLFQSESSTDLPLQFVSPTFFRRQGANYPLPEPRLVFGSLVERWNLYAPLKVPEAIAASLTERCTLRYLRLLSRSASAHDRTVGFVGRVTFHLPGASEDEAHWLGVLGSFAFYSGVGAKTTLGFGQAKPYAYKDHARVPADLVLH
jgi:CRISPR-associated endoribonuclease Cas6